MIKKKLLLGLGIFTLTNFPAQKSTKVLTENQVIKDLQRVNQHLTPGFDLTNIKIINTTSALGPNTKRFFFTCTAVANKVGVINRADRYFYMTETKISDLEIEVNKGDEFICRGDIAYNLENPGGWKIFLSQRGEETFILRKDF